ncbi:hypothetical protein FOZ62_027410, partial [Perkinsus olseni]
MMLLLYFLTFAVVVTSDGIDCTNVVGYVPRPLPVASTTYLGMHRVPLRLSGDDPTLFPRFAHVDALFVAAIVFCSSSAVISITSDFFLDHTYYEVLGSPVEKI